MIKNFRVELMGTHSDMDVVFSGVRGMFNARSFLAAPSMWLVTKTEEETPALSVERASKLLLLYETHLWADQPLNSGQPLRHRVVAMVAAMKEMHL